MKSREVQRKVGTVAVVLVGLCSAFSLNPIHPVQLQVQRPVLSLFCWRRMKASCGLAGAHRPDEGGCHASLRPSILWSNFCVGLFEQRAELLQQFPALMFVPCNF